MEHLRTILQDKPAAKEQMKQGVVPGYDCHRARQVKDVGLSRWGKAKKIPQRLKQDTRPASYEALAVATGFSSTSKL